MGPETLKILQKITLEQWSDYYNELVIYAEAKCKRWVWKTGNKENLPKGYSPESIAREAVARFYDGERVWNHEAYPGDNPVPFLKSKEVRVSESAHGFRSTPSPSPYQSAYFKEVNERIAEAIADREDLVKLHRYLQRGLKPPDIAPKMGKSVQNIYFLIRLFRRRTEDISNELFEEITFVDRRPEGGAL